MARAIFGNFASDIVQIAAIVVAVILLAVLYAAAFILEDKS